MVQQNWRLVRLLGLVAIILILLIAAIAVCCGGSSREPRTHNVEGAGPERDVFVGHAAQMTTSLLLLYRT